MAFKNSTNFVWDIVIISVEEFQTLIRRIDIVSVQDMKGYIDVM